MSYMIFKNLYTMWNFLFGEQNTKVVQNKQLCFFLHWKLFKGDAQQNDSLSEWVARIAFAFTYAAHNRGNWAGNSQNLRRRVIATQMFCTCGFRFTRCNRHPLVCQLSTEKISAIIRDQPQPTGFHQMCILSVLSRHLASILLPSFLLKARANFDLDCFTRIIPQQ